MYVVAQRSSHLNGYSREHLSIMMEDSGETRQPVYCHLVSVVLLNADEVLVGARLHLKQNLALPLVTLPLIQMALSA